LMLTLPWEVKSVPLRALRVGIHAVEQVDRRRPRPPRGPPAGPPHEVARLARRKPFRTEPRHARDGFRRLADRNAAYRVPGKVEGRDPRRTSLAQVVVGPTLDDAEQRARGRDRPRGFAPPSASSGPRRPRSLRARPGARGTRRTP
jgi:hypothetical protein